MLKSAVLCPGQGAQSIGMGRKWFDFSSAAAKTFAEADELIRDLIGLSLSNFCFNGPIEQLNRTDIAQQAIYVCSVACYRGLVERYGQLPITATAGLSLGEYTALHLAGTFDFISGLQLVAFRGKLMQEACEQSPGLMVALIGVDERQAQIVCDKAAEDEVLVCANYNAPGQIVLSGHSQACKRAVALAKQMGLGVKLLDVAGAFHSPLMQFAADGMAAALAQVEFRSPRILVWSNVTGEPHRSQDLKLLKQRLIEQIIKPVRWLQICQGLISSDILEYHELAPGTVLGGLIRRVSNKVNIISHDQPQNIA